MASQSSRFAFFLCIAGIFCAAFAMRTSAQDAQKPRFDAVGDPLPAQALHRFGTGRFCTQTEVTSLVLSHDAKWLAAADRAGHVYLWDADTGKARFVTAAGAGKRVAISPDAQWLALGEDGPFEIRGLLKKNEAPRLQLGNAPRAFAFTPDSKGIVLSAADETDLFLYDIRTGKETRRFGGLAENIDFTTITLRAFGTNEVM